MEDYTELFNKVRLALAEFTEAEPEEVEEDIVELVTDLVAQSLEERADGNWDYSEALLQKSSTYVYCDMGEDEMERYIELLEGYAMSY